MKKKHRLIGGWIMLLALCLLLSISAASAADVEFKLVPASSMRVYDDSGALEYTTEHTDGRFHPVIDVDASDWQSYMLAHRMGGVYSSSGSLTYSIKLPEDAAGYVLFVDDYNEFDFDDNAAILEELQKKNYYHMYKWYGTPGEMIEHRRAYSVYHSPFGNYLAPYQDEPFLFCVGLLNDNEEIYEVQKMKIDVGFTRSQWTAPSVRRLNSDEVNVFGYFERDDHEVIPDETIVVYQDENNDYVVELDASTMEDPNAARLCVQFITPEGAVAHMHDGSKSEYVYDSYEGGPGLYYMGDGKFQENSFYDCVLWYDAEGNPMPQSGGVQIHIKNAGGGTGDEPGEDPGVEVKLVPASSMMVHDDTAAIAYTTKHTDGHFDLSIDVDASDWQSYMLGMSMGDADSSRPVLDFSAKLPADAAGYQYFECDDDEIDFEDDAALLEKLENSNRYHLYDWMLCTPGEMFDHISLGMMRYDLLSHSLSADQQKTQIFCVGLLNDDEEIYEVQKMKVDVAFTRDEWTAPSVRKLSSNEVNVFGCYLSDNYEVIPDETILVYQDENDDYVVELDASKVADLNRTGYMIQFIPPEGAAAAVHGNIKYELAEDDYQWRYEVDYLDDGKFQEDRHYDAILWLDADGNPMPQSGSVLIHIKNAGSGTGDEPGDGSNVEFKQVPAENIAFDGYEGLLQYKAQYTDGNYKVTIDADKTDWQKYMLGQEVVLTSWHGDVPISVNFSAKAAGYVYFLEKASEYKDDAAILERLEYINDMQGYTGADYHVFRDGDTHGCLQLPPNMPILNYDMEASVLYQPSYTKKPQLFCIGLLNEDGKIYEVQKMTVEVGFTQDDWVVEPMRKASSSSVILYGSDESMNIYVDENDDYVVEVDPWKMQDLQNAYITVEWIVPEGAVSYMKDGVKDKIWYNSVDRHRYQIDPYNDGMFESFAFYTPILWLDADDNMMPQSGVITVNVKNIRADNPLQPVYLPARLDEIEPYAFANSAFASVRCPDGMSSIGAYAFKNCADLEVIYIGSDTVIDETAFDGCTSLVLIQSDMMGCPAHDLAEKLGVVFQLKEQ